MEDLGDEDMELLVRRILEEWDVAIAMQRDVTSSEGRYEVAGLMAENVLTAFRLVRREQPSAN